MRTIEKTKISIHFSNLKKEWIRCNVTYDEFNKKHFIAMAKAHNGSPKEKGLSYDAIFHVNSVRFFIKDITSFQKKWPNLLNLQITSSNKKVSGFISEQIEKNEKTFPE